MDRQSQSHKLLILSQHCDIYKTLIEEKHFSDLEITASSNPILEDQDAGVFDIVFGEPSLVSKVINRLSNVKWVQATWAGVEPLLGLGTEHSYILTNVRDTYGPLMAEYVFGYILLIERKILERLRSQQTRKWDASSSGVIKGKILGLAGVGSIGDRIAQTAKQFRMQVYGYTLKSESSKYIDAYFHPGDWEKFTDNLDYLVCTLPGTKLTENLIDQKALTTLPERAWFINVGRGKVVDENALAQALISRKIAGAVLDVFKEEPLPQDSSLWTTPNTFITFHSAAQNNPPDIAAIFVENYARFVSGEPLKYLVNFESGY